MEGPSNTKHQPEQFADLANAIDDLTRDKHDLARKAESLQALAEVLASENAGLVEAFNCQGRRLEALLGELSSMQAESGASRLAIEAMAAERDAARMAAAAAAERGGVLAAEAVALEERLLQARSLHLRAMREAEASAEAAEVQRKRAVAGEAEREELQRAIAGLEARCCTPFMTLS